MMNKKIQKIEKIVKKTRKKKDKRIKKNKYIEKEKKKEKKKEKEKETKASSLIGFGGYGCVFQPSTNCDGSTSNNKNSKYRISKIQFYGVGGAKNEIFISSIIHAIPKFKKYFSPIISSCSILPLHKLDPYILKNCPSIAEKKNDYNDVITTRTRYIYHKPIKLVLKEQTSFPKAYTILLKYIHHLLEAIELLQSMDIIHFDIKDGNILYPYKEKDAKPIIIDFGISFISSYVYESADKYIQKKDTIVDEFNTITKKHTITKKKSMTKRYNNDTKPNSLSQQIQYTLFKKSPIDKRFVNISHLKKRVYFFSPGYVQYAPEVHVIGYILKYKNEYDMFSMSDVDLLSNRIYNELLDELFNSLPYIQKSDYISEFILYYKTFVKEKKTCYEVCNELYRHVYLWDVYSIYIILFKLGLFVSSQFSVDITDSSSIYYSLFLFCLRGLSPDPTKRGSLRTFKDKIKFHLDDIEKRNKKHVMGNKKNVVKK